MLLVLLTMVISFLLEGYGAWSIAISSIHMILSVWFAIYFFRNKLERRSSPVQLIRWALIFMLLSSLGPFVLGPLSVLGYKHTMWYNISIYFYLHFQYNGWFTLAIFGIVLKTLQRYDKEEFISDQLAIKLSVLGIVFAFFHSTLGYEPPSWVLVLSVSGYLLQIAGILLFIHPRIGKALPFIQNKTSLIGKLFFGLILLCFVLKYLLPLASTMEPIRTLAFNNRNLIIAYLHLVLLGFVSGYLLWDLAIRTTANRLASFASVLFGLSFVLTEFALVLSGFGQLGTMVLYYNQFMFGLSIVLLVSTLLVVAGVHLKRKRLFGHSTT